jgi:hypothetical protein
MWSYVPTQNTKLKIVWYWGLALITTQQFTHKKPIILSSITKCFWMNKVLSTLWFNLHICLSMAWGKGTERYMNGSYVTDTCLHVEQTTCNTNTSFKCHHFLNACEILKQLKRPCTILLPRYRSNSSGWMQQHHDATDNPLFWAGLQQLRYCCSTHISNYTTLLQVIYTERWSRQCLFGPVRVHYIISTGLFCK